MYRGQKYVILIEISIVVIEIQEVENGELAVEVNNTLVYCATQLSWPLTHNSASSLCVIFVLAHETI